MGRRSPKERGFLVLGKRITVCSFIEFGQTPFRTQLLIRVDSGEHIEKLQDFSSHGGIPSRPGEDWLLRLLIAFATSCSVKSMKLSYSKQGGEIGETLSGKRCTSSALNMLAASPREP